MKHLIWCLACVCFLGACQNLDNLLNENVPLGDPITATSGTDTTGNTTTYFVELNRLPLHIQRFQEVQQSVATTPQGGAAMFIMALNVYQQYNREGVKALVTSATGPALKSDSGDESYNGFALLSQEMSLIKVQLQDHPELTKAYYKGATPTNGYQPSTPFRLEFTNLQDVTGTNRKKLFVITAGAASPRPITVAPEGNIWKVTEYSSVLVGVQ
ncbi:hypothetical protein BKI52_23970 [marine bacterium AO1-C]|nr:hypothetical protein BKI52_23970 [marine bacterium AO1-C]